MFATTDSMAHISCNMDTRGLPDMYTLSPWASGVHIRQATRAHVTTITCTYGHFLTLLTFLWQLSPPFKHISRDLICEF